MLTPSWTDTAPAALCTTEWKSASCDAFSNDRVLRDVAEDVIARRLRF